MAGRKHHFLPAALIGGFSSDTTDPLRNRTIWFRRRGMDRSIPVRAEAKGWILDLYTLRGGDGRSAGSIDHMWDLYEPQLPQAIAALVASDTGSLSADLWVRTLLPFVAGLFVRGPEYVRRFAVTMDKQVPGWRALLSQAQAGDNINYARLIEMQRLIHPFACLEWTVVHCVDSAIAITSDTGYTLMALEADPSRQVGYAIPLRSDTILTLRPGHRHCIVGWHQGQWIVQGIMHAQGTADDVAKCNDAIASAAISEIYGAAEQLIDRHCQVWRNSRDTLQCAQGPYWVARDGATMRHNEMFHADMVRRISAPPPPGTPEAILIAPYTPTPAMGFRRGPAVYRLILPPPSHEGCSP